MKNLIIAFLLTSSILLITRCSTDFDMYADYKDITIVYSMADISSDTTWVKITRAYTGPCNALLMAQNPDSSNYPYLLDVSPVGMKNGTNLEPIILDTLTIHNKPITDTIINAEFRYDRTEDTLELNNYQIQFFEDTSQNKFIWLTYEDGALTLLNFDPDYIDNWADFYDTNCSDEELSTTSPYTGICDGSTDSWVSVKIEDYPNEEVSTLLSLSLFGLNFTEVTMLEVNSANQYFFSHYDNIYSEKDFDYTNLNISEFDINDILQFDPVIVDRYID